MLDLSAPRSGVLGPEHWFSDLYVAALEGRFTGGVLIRADDGDRALFFRAGDPVHAGGAGFSDHLLGEVVVNLGLAARPLVVDALRFQASIPEEERPLLGEVLTARLGLSKDAVDRAVRTQTEARTAACFALGAGSFHAAPGEDERVRSVGRPVDGWAVLLRGLTEHGSAEELRGTADRLLGRAVRLKGSARQLEALTSLSEPIRHGLKYLQKPRKPDQLERALDRRLARGLLRMLELLELLELLPVARAIPIPKVAARLETFREDSPNPAPSPRPAQSERPAPSRTDPAAARSADRSPFSEVERRFEELGQLDHFGVLGLARDDPPDLVRRRYTELAKRFHPDAFSGRNVPPDIEEKIRALSARLNEAYRVLSQQEARSEYEALLEDERFAGDSRRADQIREASLKVKMALVHIKKREFDKGRAMLRAAVEADPHSRAYQAHLAWSMFVDPKFDREEAKREGLPLLVGALATENENPVVHFYLGRAYKELGQMKQALQHFNAASKLDRSFADAQREARLLAGRLEKDKKSQSDVKGAFGKLFRR